MTPTRSRPLAAGRPLGLRAVPLLLAAWLVGSGGAFAQQAQQQGGATRGGSQPVEIVADSLVVEQERQLATFTGNVDAVQGDLRLRADKLLVHYDQGGDEDGDRTGGAGQPTTAGGQGIRRIEVFGNVFLTQPGESAKGDRGTYEPGTGALTLDGNVVLTRGQNVIRGARLESNRRSGVSTVLAAEPGAAGRPEQRVRALFAPERKAGATAPAPASPPAPGGRSAQ